MSVFSACLPTFSTRHEALVPAGTSTGTTVSSNASANVKGTAAAIGTAGFDYRSVTVFINNGAIVDYTVDILVDGAVVIPDLHYLGQRTNSGGTTITVPLYIRSGGVITAKCAASTGSSSLSVAVTGSSNNPGGGPSFSSVVALYTPSSSKGVALDPGGTINTDGSWTQLTAPAVRIGGVFALFGGNGVQSRASSMLWRVDLGVGLVATPPTVFVPGLHLATDTTDKAPRPPSAGPWGCDLPATTPVAARCRCSVNTATTRLIDVALYGLVP